MTRRRKTLISVWAYILLGLVMLALARETYVFRRADRDLLYLDGSAPKEGPLWNERAVKKILSALEDQNAFRFAVVGDSHENYETLLRITDSAERRGADFLVHLGDFTYWGRHHEYRRMLDAIGDVKLPLVILPGNHDLEHVGMECFLRLLGPLDFEFTLGKLRFLCVDSASEALDTRIHQLPAEGRPIPEDSLPERGFDLGRVLDMETRIRDAERTILFTHVPPAVKPFTGHAFTRGLDAFTAMLERNRDRVDAVFCGHIHAFGRSRVGGVELIVCGGGGGKMNRRRDGTAHREIGIRNFHYVLVTVEGDRIEKELVVLDSPERVVVIQGEFGGKPASKR